jgi:hypothetical protein
MVESNHKGNPPGFGAPLSLVLVLVALVTGPSIATAQLDNLEFVGHTEENPFHLMNAEIVGSRVFISEGLGGGGMETYDISDPVAPLRIDQDGPTTWRTRAYPELNLLLGFGHHTGVAIYDISDTAATVLLGEYDPPPGTAYEGGALRGDTLYVAAHQIGIEVFDVSNLASIVPIDTIDLGENAAWDADVLGDYLIVANGRFGLAIVDLGADPPSVVATVELPGLANDILISGALGYLSLGPSGLASIDLSDPANPFLLDHNQETGGNVTSLGLLGDTLVSGSWFLLETYDVSDPANIVRSGWDNTKTWAMGADIEDDPGGPLIAVADWRGVSTYRPNADLGPDIEVYPREVDFGQVGTSKDTTVFVYNRGSATLDVSTVDPNDFTSSPSIFSIPPGGSQEVTITANTFNPRRLSIRYNSNDPDEASVRQFVYKNNPFPQIGSPAPDFTLLGTDGLWHSLSDELGRVVYLEFGANW